MSRNFLLFFLNVLMQTIECWWEAGFYSMIYKLIMNNNLCIIYGGYAYCSCTSRESQTTLTVLEMSIDKNSGSLRVSLGFPHWLGDSPRWSQTFHNRSYCAPVPVIRDPSYSDGRPECPPSVWYFPEFDTSKFTLHILSETPAVSHRLKYILLLLFIPS